MADKAEKTRLIVVCGPTATGKTRLAVELAKALGGEVVSADSMQIYKGLSVGTAKPTEEERQGVPHHLLDILEPQQRFSAADFVERAGVCIAGIAASGRLPIVAGGTGLYIESLVKGIRFSPQQYDPALRAALEREAKERGAAAMHAELEAIDPEYAAQMHPNNGGRVLRALELYRQTGITMTQQRRQSLPDEPPYNALLLGLDFADRQTLYRRIDARVEEMAATGLLQEAKLVYDNRNTFTTAAQAIGYKEFFAYFEGRAGLQECIAALQQATRRYAKRQLTWFRRMEDMHWLPADAPDLVQRALALARAHLPSTGG